MNLEITSVSASHRKGALVAAMSPGALAAWLDSYDRWVTLWNEHERSRSLPLSPEWGDAMLVGNVGGSPMAEIAFTPRRWFDQNIFPYGVIRMNRKGWTRYAEGWSFCRTPAPRPVVGGWWVHLKIAGTSPEPWPEGHPNGIAWADAAWKRRRTAERRNGV